MKKKRLFECVIVVAVLFVGLSGCSKCEHEFGDTLTIVQNSTCSTEGLSKRVCSKCEEEELHSIEKKAHIWTEVTCQKAKTCEMCGFVEGEVGEHSWSDATCMQAKKCSTCGILEGEVGDHHWSGATCTEAKKCNTCGEVQGEALGHDYGMSYKCSRCEMLAERASCDFREIKFGDSKEVVKAYETLDLSVEEPEALGYKVDIGGVNTLIVYYFNQNNQLYQVGLSSQDKHTNSTLYLTDFESLKDYLVENYGEPDDDKEYKGPLYKYCGSKGEALKLEEYARLTTWDCETYSIILGVMSDNYKISLAVSISSTEYSK